MGDHWGGKSLGQSKVASRAKMWRSEEDSMELGNACCVSIQNEEECIRDEA